MYLYVFHQQPNMMGFIYVFLILIFSYILILKSEAVSSTVCDDGRFDCGSGDCIPSGWVCDGDEDCTGAQDEADCGTEQWQCDPEEWRCDNGRCVDEDLKCDGRNDCGDRSDELQIHCPKYKAYCPDGMFRCSMESTTCIPYTWVCDGQSQCPDSEDELHCDFHVEHTCTSREFLCQGSGRCIPRSWMCDWQDDCEHGEDEHSELCGWRPTPNTTVHQGPYYACSGELEFRCDTGECLPLDQVCDEKHHCMDSSDEGGSCESSCHISNGGCSHVCHPTPQGAICECLPGYDLLLDEKTCQDSNECSTLLYSCSQICINQQGSYRCDCDHGYRLEPDGKTCKALGLPAELIVENLNELRKITMRQQHYSIKAKEMNMKQIKAFDLDIEHMSVYWTTTDGDVIERLSVDGRISTVFRHIGACTSIAVDWLTHNVYYIDGQSKVIAACNVGSGKCAEIIHGNMGKPLSLVLDSVAGLMFWSDWGTHARIERASMDGSQRRILLHHHIIWPNSICLDLIRKRIYWVDSKLNVIESADYNGMDRVKLLESTALHSYGLAMFENYIYWSDVLHGTVNRVNKFTGQNQTAFIQNISQPMMIKVLHPLQQPTSQNRCDKLPKACSQLCLLTPGGAACRCPRDMMPVLTDETLCTDHMVPTTQKVTTESHPLRTESTTLSSAEIPTILSIMSIEDEDGGCFEDFCFNGGICYVLNGTLKCLCLSVYNGTRCENEITLQTQTQSHSNKTWIVCVVAAVVLVIMCTATVIVCCRRRQTQVRPDVRSIWRFKHTLLQKNDTDTNQSTRVLVDSNAFENPGFNLDQDDENNNNTKMKLTMSCSADSIDSAFLSCRIGDEDENDDQEDYCDNKQNTYTTFT